MPEYNKDQKTMTVVNVSSNEVHQRYPRANKISRIKIDTI
jgi:hypothetical protein